MDLRLYTKSGNEYYVDISNHEFEEMLTTLRNCMDRGELLTIEKNNKVDVIHCREVEYFEIIRCGEENEEISLEGFNKFARGI